MKQPSIEHAILIGIVLMVIFSSIPFKQVVNVTKTVEYESDDDYYIQSGFGGPAVTWVTVMCNRTAEIRFMYQSGVWISAENILLASFTSTSATFYYSTHYATNMVEIISDGPIQVVIVFGYLMETESSIFESILHMMKLY